MKIMLEADHRATGLPEAWRAYAQMYKLQDDVDSDAIRRAFAFAYQEGYKAGLRKMADRTRAALAPAVDELAFLAQDPNQKTT